VLAARGLSDGARITRAMATGDFAACVSLLSHQRSVEGANPCSAANDAALAPLSRHARTRPTHFVFVSASLMHATVRPKTALRKYRLRAGDTMFTLKQGFDFGEVARRGLLAAHAEMLEKALAYNVCRMATKRRFIAANGNDEVAIARAA